MLVYVSVVKVNNHVAAIDVAKEFIHHGDYTMVDWDCCELKEETADGDKLIDSVYRKYARDNVTEVWVAYDEADDHVYVLDFPEELQIYFYEKIELEKDRDGDYNFEGFNSEHRGVIWKLEINQYLHSLGK